MKKAIVFSLILTLVPSLAFSMTRDGRKVPQTTVLVSGGETIRSTKVVLGASGVATQLTATDTPCVSATVCASPQATDIVMVGDSTVAVANPFKFVSSISVDNGYPIGTGTSVDRCNTFAVDNVNKLYGASRASLDTVLVTSIEA